MPVTISKVDGSYKPCLFKIFNFFAIWRRFSKILRSTLLLTIRPLICLYIINFLLKVFANLKIKSAWGFLIKRYGYNFFIALSAFKEDKVQRQHSFWFDFISNLWCGVTHPPKLVLQISRGSLLQLVTLKRICKKGVVLLARLPYALIQLNPIQPSPSMKPAKYDNSNLFILSIIP